MNLEKELSEPVRLWSKSVHKENGVTCHDCHGGNPGIKDENAMDPKAGFIGTPAPKSIPALCAKCHADPKMMRQFNIRTDQFAEYKTSVHGRRLFEKGDEKVATCVSCHGSHDIRKKSDPQSSVFHTNVPDTCAKCHSNAEYMKPYNIPTDQFEEYKKSYHGSILYGKIEGKNPSLVPNCADCHGIHGATPPGGGEVVNVCGNCHFVVVKFFREGKHYEALESNGVPRCIDCHGNHNIQYPTVALFKDSGNSLCAQCHDQGTPQMDVAEKIGTMLENIESKARAIEESVGEVERTGKNIDDILLELSKVKNNMVKSKTISHTVSVEKIKELTDGVNTSIEYIEKKIKDIKAEVEQRKIFMYVAIVLIFAIVFLLYLRFLRSGS
jgi:predicted CXXCH cytochrome family protein